MKNKRRFNVYEIEHDGDLQDALAAVKAAGGSEVEVLRTDFECENAVLIAAFDRVLSIEQIKAALEQEGVIL